MNKQKNHSNERLLVYAILWVVCYIGSYLIIRLTPGSLELGIGLSFITALAFAIFIYKYYKSIGLMDEVQIKIQMEAVVFAFALSLLMIMTMGLLELVIQLDKADWNFRNLVPCFITFYFFGLFISNRKYNFEDEKHN